MSSSLANNYFGGIDYDFLRALNRESTKYELKDAYAQNVWVRRGITAIANAVRATPFNVVNEDTEEVIRTPSEEAGGWLIDLFDKPNTEQTWHMFIEFTLVHLWTKGACFWLPLTKLGTYLAAEGDRPAELYAYGPKAIEPRYGGVGGSRFLGWTFNVNGRKVPLEKWQVYRIAFPNTENPYEPLSPLRSVELSVQADHAASVFNTTFFQKGAHVGGVIKSRGKLAKEEKDEIRAFFDDTYSGPDKAGKTLILDGDADYTEVGRTHQDMMYGEQKELSRTEILACLGVPEVLAGIYKNAPQASELSQIKVFYENTVLPLLALLEDVWYLNFRVYMKYDRTKIEALQKNLTEQLTQLQQAETAGIPLNDAILLVGMEKRDYSWGDTWYKSTTLVDVQATPEPEPAQEDPGVGARVVNPALSKADEALHLEIVKAVLNPSESLVEAAVESFFADLKAAQIERLEGWGSHKRLDMGENKSSDRFLVDADTWDKKLADDMEAPYKTIVRKTVKQTRRELGGIRADELSRKMQEVVKERQLKVKIVSQTMRSRMKKVIEQGVKEGLTPAQLAKRLKTRFDLTAGASTNIARTETTAITNGARFELFKAERGRKKYWITAGDERVRTDHVTFGSMAPQKMSFNYAPVVGSSGKLRYPGDSEAPASQVCGCRCIIALLGE